jgi:hypothetical protein
MPIIQRRVPRNRLLAEGTTFRCFHEEKIPKPEVLLAHRFQGELADRLRLVMLELSSRSWKTRK